MPAAPLPALAGVFADLATKIGLSRPAGQCLAAIWRAPEAPCADDLVAALGLSRSNVSTALKELRGWGLIGIARTPGDRREYFVAPADPWAILRQVIAERRRRDIAPILDRLYALEAESADARVAALCEVFEGISGWLAGLARCDPEELAQLMQPRPGAAMADEGDPAPRTSRKKREE